MKRTIMSVLVFCLLLVFAPAAHATDYSPDGRAKFYYVIHVGMYKYAVNDVVNRWNRNPYRVLVRATSCADLQPCVDIYSAEDRTAVFPNSDYDTTHTVAGEFFGRKMYLGMDSTMEDFWQGNTIIYLYTWWESNDLGNADQLAKDRRHLFCHELGHYMIGSASLSHPDGGCVSNHWYRLYPSHQLNMIPPASTL